MRVKTSIVLTRTLDNREVGLGRVPVLQAAWGDGYCRRVLNFIDKTGMDAIVTDGPYHGDVCASTKHSYIIMVWQIRSCASGKRACSFTMNAVRAVSRSIRQISITSTVQTNAVWGIAKRISAYPASEQILIARQNIYDGTYEKTPSMGWMFVPLVEYHGGGAAATFEPLCEHLDDYEWHLAQNFGSGVNATAIGVPGFLILQQTKTVVKKWVDFYQKISSTIGVLILIHVRRPDGRSIDCVLHANAQINPCGLAMLYNPTRAVQRMTLKLPLYYTGLSEIAKIREEEGEPKRYKIDRNYNVEIPIEMEAKSVSYLRY